MISFRAVFFLNGLLLCFFALAMLVPLIVDYFIYQTADWSGFAISAFITGLIGSLLALSNQTHHRLDLKVREAFLLTSMSWVVTSFFSALPFYLSSLKPGFVDAWFEAVSALTTTGATTFVGLDSAPKGFLLWRAILQWLGGTGIIVMAMTILPILRIGGMQLFRSEFSDRSDKILPRVSQIAVAILSTYFFFTVLCTILLKIAGMEIFDAICHAMAAVSTGGLSTKDASVAAFNSLSIELILTTFMVMGGTTFVLFIRFWYKDATAFVSDSQLRTYLSILVVSASILTLWQWGLNEESLLTSLRYAWFITVSTMTSSGFTIVDYTAWGSFPCMMVFILGLIGGCTGSTSGGIKVFRFQVLFAVAMAHLRQLRRPHGVYLATYQSLKISEGVAMSVFTFVTLYGFSWVCLSLILSFLGLDFTSALSGAAAAIGNVGPGLGEIIGPAGTYITLTPGAKLSLMSGMIMGRLELLTMFVLFMPSFWRD